MLNRSYLTKEKVTAAKLAAMQEARSTSGANRPIRKSRAAISYTQSPNGTPPPAERESWELACEICGKKGWNIVSRIAFWNPSRLHTN